jgi:hypothetical protein
MRCVKLHKSINYFVSRLFPPPCSGETQNKGGKMYLLRVDRSIKLHLALHVFLHPVFHSGGSTCVALWHMICFEHELTKYFNEKYGKTYVYSFKGTSLSVRELLLLIQKEELYFLLHVNKLLKKQSFADGPNYVEWWCMIRRMFNFWWMFKTNFTLYSLLATFPVLLLYVWRSTCLKVSYMIELSEYISRALAFLAHIRRYKFTVASVESSNQENPFRERSWRRTRVTNTNTLK